MIVVGVDENGLGPRLGPLIATAVTVDVAEYDAKRLRRVAGRAGVGDSKETTGFGQMSSGESLALAVAEQLTGSVPRDMDALLMVLSLDDVDTLKSPCPSDSASQCWRHSVTLPAFGGDVAVGRTMLGKLSAKGIHVTRARSVVHCAGRLNRSLAAGHSKLVVDLSLFERLLLDARAVTDGDLLAHCGMVGGMREYPRYFQHLNAEAAQPLESPKGHVAYNVRGLGEVRFEVSADDNHVAVSLASMIGKYVRELSMERQNRFYLEEDSSLPRPSGYHDPVTTRFVAQSAELRTRLGIVDECFARAR